MWGLDDAAPSLQARLALATLQCKASQGRIVVWVGDTVADDASVALAKAQAFGIDLGETGTFAVRMVSEDELHTVADVLHSAFSFPLEVTGPLHLGTDLGASQGSWTVANGAYWGALYEVFPDCEESIGAQYVLVLAKEDSLPAPRWSAMPHLTDTARTPGGAPFPAALALPGDATDDAPLPDLRALFGGDKPAVRKPKAAADAGAKKSPDAVASRLFAAIAGLGDDHDDDDDDDDDAAPQHDPFGNFIKALVAQEQLALVEGASVRKLAERLELALERDPMMFQRPGDWFFDQREVDELFASDDELRDGLRDALGG